MPISENKKMVTSQTDDNTQPNKSCNQEHSTNGNVCSIPKINVEIAIQKSIKATQAMKIFLTSLRDDLKAKKYQAPQDQVAGDEQTRKRKDITDKLEHAYIGYKNSITDILKPIQVKKPNVMVSNPSLLIGPTSSCETCEVIELSESDAEDDNN